MEFTGKRPGRGSEVPGQELSNDTHESSAQHSCPAESRRRRNHYDTVPVYFSSGPGGRIFRTHLLDNPRSAKPASTCPVHVTARTVHAKSADARPRTTRAACH